MVGGGSVVAGGSSVVGGGSVVTGGAVVGVGGGGSVVAGGATLVVGAVVLASVVVFSEVVAGGAITGSCVPPCVEPVEAGIETEPVPPSELDPPEVARNAAPTPATRSTSAASAISTTGRRPTAWHGLQNSSDVGIVGGGRVRPQDLHERSERTLVVLGCAVRAEPGHLGLALRGEQHARGIEGSVRDALPMGIRDRGRDVGRDPPCLVLTERDPPRADARASLPGRIRARRTTRRSPHPGRTPARCSGA